MALYTSIGKDNRSRNFKSLQRQFNKYGFVKVQCAEDRSLQVFRHSHFRRYRQDLLHVLKVKGTGSSDATAELAAPELPPSFKHDSADSEAFESTLLALAYGLPDYNTAICPKLFAPFRKEERETRRLPFEWDMDTATDPFDVLM